MSQDRCCGAKWAITPLSPRRGWKMVLPAVLGYFIDGWLNTTPGLRSLQLALGFTAGLIHLISIVNRKECDESSDKKPPP